MIYKLNVIEIKIQEEFLVEIKDRQSLVLTKKGKRTRIAKVIFEKQNKFRRFTLSGSRFNKKAIVIKVGWTAKRINTWINGAE